MKDPAAVNLGRRGGLKSAAGRIKNLTPEQRSEIARNAATKRWEAYRRKHPAKKKKAAGK